MGQPKKNSQKNGSFYEKIQAKSKPLAFIIYLILLLIFGTLLLRNLMWLLSSIDQLSFQNYQAAMHQGHVTVSVAQPSMSKDILNAVLENLTAPAIFTLTLIIILTKIIEHLLNTCWAGLKYIAKWVWVKVNKIL